MSPDIVVVVALRRFAIRMAFVAATLLVPGQDSVADETWRGLVVADELTDCPLKYKRKDYHYDRPTLLPLLKDRTAGAIFSPYTRRIFLVDDDVDVEHIVSTKQAHVSGLCMADAKTRLAFGSDLLNLTLAAKGVNQAKAECNAATWIPPENHCWFARRVLEVRRKYELTINRAEADALEAILRACKSDDEFMDRTVSPGVEALNRWDTNKNGRISCNELKNNKVNTPIDTLHSAWPFVKDQGCDGKTCMN